MRLHRRRGSVVPPSLTEAWREAAGAEAPPSSAALEELCGHTLAEWSSLSWADCVLVFDAWGFMAQQHGASFALPRPLLRLMGTAAWQHGKTASLAELNLVAARCAPFMRGSSSADLVRSVLDAIIHAAASEWGRARGVPWPGDGRPLCVERWAAQPPTRLALSVHPPAAEAAKLDGKAALSLGAVTGMAPWASRTPAVQRDLLLLRQAASTARDPAEEMLAAKVGVVKLQLRCDSITGERQRAGLSTQRGSPVGACCMALRARRLSAHLPTAVSPSLPLPAAAAASHVAHSLARDSLQNGGDMKASGRRGGRGHGDARVL